MTRCDWATTERSIAYHDAEWGRAQHDDRALFESLTLEGAQAGLSWETILAKRAGYRTLFMGFDPALVARFDDSRIAEIATDARIVRHRGKIASTVGNARAFLAVQEAFGSFDAYLWAFVDGAPVVTRWRTRDELPDTTPLARRIGADLRARGFTFVGPTIVYAFLQATGVVDDHLATCFRSETHAEGA